jgi:DNA-binding Xre family transcriptional regulator
VFSVMCQDLFYGRTIFVSMLYYLHIVTYFRTGLAMAVAAVIKQDRMLGLRLETAQLRQQWSNRRLAEESGVALSTIQRLRTGQGKSPSVWTVYALADALEVPIDWLTGRQDGK